MATWRERLSPGFNMNKKLSLAEQRSALAGLTTATMKALIGSMEASYDKDN